MNYTTLVMMICIQWITSEFNIQHIIFILVVFSILRLLVVNIFHFILLRLFVCLLLFECKVIANHITRKDNEDFKRIAELDLEPGRGETRRRDGRRRHGWLRAVRSFVSQVRPISVRKIGKEKYMSLVYFSWIILIEIYIHVWAMYEYKSQQRGPQTHNSHTWPRLSCRGL